MFDVENLLIRKLSKKPILLILFSLKSGPKRWSELEKLTNKRYVHESLRELFHLGLIEATILNDTPMGTKAYKLSPLGEKIVKLIEEMQEEFEKWHYQPESDEEFLEGGWDK